MIQTRKLKKPQENNYVVINMVKTAWAKHLYNAYNSVKSGDKVYDLSGNIIFAVVSEKAEILSNLRGKNLFKSLGC